MVTVEKSVQHRIRQIVFRNQTLVDPQAVGVVFAVAVRVLSGKSAGDFQHVPHGFGRFQPQCLKPVRTNPQNIGGTVTGLNVGQAVQFSADGRRFHSAAAVLMQHLIGVWRRIIRINLGQIGQLVVFHHALELRSVHPHQVGQIV